MALTAKPVMEISIDDNELYTVKTHSLKSSETHFKLGEEFDETRMDGVTVKVFPFRCPTS